MCDFSTAVQLTLSLLGSYRMIIPNPRVGPAIGVPHTQGPLLKLAAGVARARKPFLAWLYIYNPGK
jgi:hypothetical protein